jgi:hypothetical protein
MRRMHYFPRCLRLPIRKAGCLYSPSCREGVFSETHIQPVASLYTSVPLTDHLLLDRYTRFPQDVGVLDRYAGFGRRSRSYTTGHVEAVPCSIARCAGPAVRRDYRIVSHLSGIMSWLRSNVGRVPCIGYTPRRTSALSSAPRARPRHTEPRQEPREVARQPTVH